MVLKYETEENPGEDTAYVLPAAERTGVLSHARLSLPLMPVAEAAQPT